MKSKIIIQSALTMRLFIQIILSCFLSNCILCKSSCLQEIRPSIRYTLRNPYDFTVKFNTKNSVFSHVIPPTKFITLVNDDQNTTVLRALEWALFSRNRNDDSFLILPAFAEHSIDIDISTFFDLSLPGNYSIYIKNGENEATETNKEQGSSLYLESIIEENYLSITEFKNNKQALKTTRKEDLRNIREARITITDSSSSSSPSSSLTFQIEKNYKYCDTRWTFLRNCYLYDHCKIQHAKLNPDEIYERQKVKNTKISNGRKEEVRKEEGRFLASEYAMTKSIYWGSTLFTYWPGFQRSQLKRATQYMWIRLNNLLDDSNKNKFKAAVKDLFRNEKYTTKDVKDPFVQVRDRFRNIGRGVNMIQYYAFTGPSVFAYVRGDSTRAEVYWNIELMAGRMGQGGILTLSTALLHEFLHAFVGLKDVPEPDSDRGCYSKSCCVELGKKDDDLALSNAANYHHVFDQMVISFTIKNYQGYPCALERETDRERLKCNLHSSSDVFECDLDTENQREYYCKEIKKKHTSLILNEHGVTHSPTGKLRLKKKVNGGWLIYNPFTEFGWNHEWNSQVMGASIGKKHYTAEFELFFDEIDSMRRFILAPNYIFGDYKSRFVEFSPNVGEPGKLVTPRSSDDQNRVSVYHFDDDSTAQLLFNVRKKMGKREKATTFTYFGGDSTGVFRINVPKGEEARWVGLKHNIFDIKVITDESPEVFKVRGLTDGTAHWQDIKICQNRLLKRCVHEAWTSTDLEVSTINGQDWYIYDVDNPDPDIDVEELYFRPWVSGERDIFP